MSWFSVLMSELVSHRLLLSCSRTQQLSQRLKQSESISVWLGRNLKIYRLAQHNYTPKDIRHSTKSVWRYPLGISRFGSYRSFFNSGLFSSKYCYRRSHPTVCWHAQEALYGLSKCHLCLFRVVPYLISL
jgi:hypothetical protein